MIRRIIRCTTGSTAGLTLLATLVVGGLTWVSITALRVEQSQRETAAQAEAVNRERLALWRLDSHMLSPLGLENNRPYTHYFPLYSPTTLVLDDRGNTQNEVLRVPSPLLSADLPPWLALHVNIDSERGWDSPQVPSLELRDRLMSDPLDISIVNCTSEREQLLNKMKKRFDIQMLLRRMIEQDNMDPDVFLYPVPVPHADEPSEVKRSPNVPFSRHREVLLTSNSLAGWARRGDFNEQAMLIPSMITGPFSDLWSNTMTLRYGTYSPTQQAMPGPTQVQELQNPNGLNFAGNKLYGNTTITNDNNGGQRGGRGSSEDRDAEARNAAVSRTFTRGGAYDIQTKNPGMSQNTIQNVAPIRTAPQAQKALEPQAPQQELASSFRYQSSAQPTALCDDVAVWKYHNGYYFESSANTLKKLACIDTNVKAVIPIDPLSKFSIRKTGSNPFDPLNNVCESKPGPTVAPMAVHLGPMRPRWIIAEDGTKYLALLRPAQVESKIVYQGAVIDWSLLKQSLIEQIADLFPNADLEPVETPTDSTSKRDMSALPVRFNPGEEYSVPVGWSTLRTGLVIAWVAALLSIVAVALGGRAIIAMSERRIRFASAVTHELRSPLTTMQLYLDLLNSGLITDEAKKAEYLNTLATEADRLNRLVENVLDFARLEKKSAQALAQTVGVNDLLDKVHTTWMTRLKSEGFDLVTESTVSSSQISIDPRVLEQVLGNLIDNARKYSKSATDPRIWIVAQTTASGCVAIDIEDRGPGIPAAERKSIFKPFQRGTSSTDTGGTGLGLSLARQWIELYEGTLTYHPAPGGTGSCFRIELPSRKPV